MTTSLLHSRLRTLAIQRGLHRIGIEADTDSFPCRLLWRDSFTGDSDLLCRCSRFTIIEKAKEALDLLAEMRFNRPTVFAEALILRELERRVQVGREQRKAVAA